MTTHSTGKTLVDTLEPENSLVRESGSHLSSKENQRDEVSSEVPIDRVPNYATFQHLIAVGRRGTAPGNFESPRAVAIQENTGNIYVADLSKHCIQIFSGQGNYLQTFGGKVLSASWGVLLYKDSVYVTDCDHHSIFLFSLLDFTMIKRIGKNGSGKEDFNYPRQLVISPNELIYVADQDNNRLQILNTDLVFQRSLHHLSMTSPFDIKFSSNHMFVLSSVDNPCIHIFNLSGEKIRSMLTRGRGKQVRMVIFFCLDAHNNLLINDWGSNSVKVFSPEGDLLHILGEKGYSSGMHVSGIAILKRTQLVCVSQYSDYALRIFSD